jgi:pantothenate kinase
MTHPGSDHLAGARASELAAALAATADRSGHRLLVGLVGAPGIGKSTLAACLASELGPRSAVLGMDGFHKSIEVCEQEGSLNRRGAPETFDVDGLLVMLTRLRQQGRFGRPERIYAPRFDRDLEQPVGGATIFSANVDLVIVEGNYLLLDAPGWLEVGSCLDLSWYLEGDETARLERLVARHHRYGKSLDEARDWATGSDQVNTELVRGTRGSATNIIRWTYT